MPYTYLNSKRTATGKVPLLYNTEEAEAVEGQTITLDIEANSGYGLKELRVINGVNFTMGTNISLETLSNGNSRLTFTMPDDIVTLQPVFAKGENVVDGIRIVNADGRKSTVIYDLNGHRYNNSNSLSPGIYIKDGKKILIKWKIVNGGGATVVGNVKQVKQNKKQQVTITIPENGGSLIVGNI